MWIFGRKGPSGFSACSTAEEVTLGIDGTGLTAIVTGTSSGIGTETTRIFALCGIHVIMGVRNVEAGKKAKENILKENPDAKIQVMELDLSPLASVRKFAENYNYLGLPLNLLINNAGIMAVSHTLSTYNIELQFATNHLGHFLLTNLLLETMKSTARESHVEGRVVNISSGAYKMFAYKEGIRFDKINDKDGLISPTIRYTLKNVQQGAATTCYVALHPQVKGVSGEYFANSNISETTSLAKDENLAKKLWDFSLTLTESTWKCCC